MRTWRFEKLVSPAVTTSYDDLHTLANAIAADGDNSNGIPAAYTYLGQFTAHDLTELRRTPDTPESGVIDIADLSQARKPVLDLDSIYGAGLDDSVVPYERDTGKFVLGRTADRTGRKTHRDLPRYCDGKPLIPDARNDENLLVAQMHVLFLHFHNKLVDHYLGEFGASASADVLFKRARQETILTYQWIVLRDFAKRVLPAKVFERIVVDGDGELLKRDKSDPAIAVEFSGAAFRMGHSMVRNSYDFGGLARFVDFADLFSMTGLGILSDDVRLPERMIVRWSKFLGLNSDADPVASGLERSDNQASRIDTGIAESMRHIPHHCGHGNIIELNLRRGKEIGLATGQEFCAFLFEKHPDVASAVDLAVVSSDELFDGMEIDADSVLRTETPLWAYVLSEARHYVKHNGPTHLASLGTMGGWIVADGLRAASAMADISLADSDWSPATSIIGQSKDGDRSTLTLEDLVHYTYPDDG